MASYVQPRGFRDFSGGRIFGLVAYPQGSSLTNGTLLNSNNNNNNLPSKGKPDDYYQDNKAFSPREKPGDDVSVSLFPTASRIAKEKEAAQRSPKLRKCLSLSKYIIPIVIAIIIIVVIVVVPLVHESKKKKSPGVPSVSEQCVISEEARGKGLLTLVNKVEETFLKYYAGFATLNPAITSEKLWKYYKPFSAKPSEIKESTDASLKLLAELEEIWKNIDMNKLKTRERKIMYEAREFFKMSFGMIFEANYYTGDWMFEPNVFCWQPSCLHLAILFGAMPLMAPKDLSQVEHLISIIQQHNTSIYQHIENMRLGVKAGMVHSIEPCRAGFLAYRHMFASIAIKKEQGILDMMNTSDMFKPEFLEKITPEDQREWERKHGEDIISSFKRNLVEHAGKPIVAVLRYLEFEHLRHCPPSNVTSGLATLPLKYVYVDGNPDFSRPTTQRLPTGEPLNGKEVYKIISRSLVAKAITPEELLRIGEEQLKLFYGEAVALVKQVTSEANEEQAIAKFKRLMADRSMYYNAEPFPDNESDDNAFLLCSSDDMAKRHCPKRWAAFQRYSQGITKIEKDLKTRMSQLFYTSGPKITTPKCGMENGPSYAPSTFFRSYLQSWTTDCNSTSMQTMPFFMDNYGPKFADHSLTAHETLPGHHLEVQGFTEYFMDKCGDAIAWMSDQSFYSGFSEGWAFYAEHPLMDKDLNMYARDPLSRYGMLQQMIMASLRLIIESGLHVRGMTRSEAFQLFKNYTWDETDQASKEITRYQSSIGQSITYMIGRTDIVKAREKAERELGKEFSLQDFHYEILRQGDAPLEYMALHIDRYILCKKHGKDNDCDITEIETKT